MQLNNLNKDGKITIFVPIRRGSKRIKNKNIKALPGFRMGLTELKIKQLNKLRLKCKKNKKINLDFVISTDCKKVKKFVQNIRWIKTFNRDKLLATDDSLSKLIKHVPSICKNQYILWTHVTSPLFDEKDYINFIKKFFKMKKKYKTSKSGFSADLLQKFFLDHKGKWISHNYKKKKWPRTQDLKPHFIINSAAFISSRDVYLKENDRLCKKPIPILSKYCSGFDIDTLEDFKILKNEHYIKKLKS